MNRSIFVRMTGFRIALVAAAVTLLVTAACRPSSGGSTTDGLDLSNNVIPLEDILSGGPPKDGIPALTSPSFLSVTEAESDGQIGGDDLVVGFSDPDGGDDARAYPISILNWHEVVNDDLGGTSVAVTYCPLTGTAMVFDRNTRGRELTFGVSGRLFQSNVLMYDHQTDSLWSQLAARSVTGEHAETKLTALPSVVTTWAEWKRRHPGTRVLSNQTGFSRDYARNPYAGYESTESLLFDVKPRDSRLRSKARVLGIVLDGRARAYPIEAVQEAGGTIEDEMGNRRIAVETTGPSATASSGGRRIAATDAYWFAWFAFHPDTEIWRAGTGEPSSGTNALSLDTVVVNSTDSYWTGFMGGDFVPGLGSSKRRSPSGLFVVSGTISNPSPHRVRSVELAVDLVDENGKVVFHQQAFNVGAESMLDRDTGLADEPFETTPIDPGGGDRYRTAFFANELPEFETARVSVVAVEAAVPR